MEKSKAFSKKLKALQAQRVDNIQILCKWSFEELEVLKTNFYLCIENAKKENREETEVYVGERLMQLHEAIDVKKGNEEQAWDYLT